MPRTCTTCGHLELVLSIVLHVWNVSRLTTQGGRSTGHFRGFWAKMPRNAAHLYLTYGHLELVLSIALHVWNFSTLLSQGRGASGDFGRKWPEMPRTCT